MKRYAVYLGSQYLITIEAESDDDARDKAHDMLVADECCGMFPTVEQVSP